MSLRKLCLKRDTLTTLNEIETRVVQAGILTGTGPTEIPDRCVTQDDAQTCRCAPTWDANGNRICDPTLGGRTCDWGVCGIFTGMNCPGETQYFCM